MEGMRRDNHVRRSGSTLPRRVAVLLALMLGLLCATGVLARAELTASGNLFITFNGGIAPDALPRHRAAPITVSMAGKVRTLSGDKPPPLRNVTIALNRAGVLDTQGLPTCAKGQLEGSTGAQALASCAGALVGRGRYRARTTFPEQPTEATVGTILAFNAKLHGRQAILGQVYSIEPARSTSVIVFEIRHPAGTFGTVLSGSVPSGLSKYSYLKRISLSLHRTYSYHGRLHSYLSAPCSAPAGLSKAAFPFVHASLSFADGRTLSATLTRTCKVRG
jgi:hypothetical protein